MKPRSDADVVWVPVSEIAHEYNRHPFTMRLWCASGYMLSLGYKVKKDQTGHWLVGVSHSEYSAFRKFRNQEPLQNAIA